MTARILLVPGRTGAQRALIERPYSSAATVLPLRITLCIPSRFQLLRYLVKRNASFNE
jgi:hypothetical protein